MKLFVISVLLFALFYISCVYAASKSEKHTNEEILKLYDVLKKNKVSPKERLEVFEAHGVSPAQLKAALRERRQALNLNIAQADAEEEPEDLLNPKKRATPGVDESAITEPAQCPGEGVLDDAVVTDAVIGYIPRDPQNDEILLTYQLGEFLGLYRMAAFISPIMYYNTILGLRNMAFNISAYIAITGDTNIPYMNCFRKKLACDLNYATAEQDSHYFSFGWGDSIYEFPNWCVQDFDIVAAEGYSAAEIHKNVYEAERDLLLDTDYPIVTAQCFRSLTEDLPGASYYYCTYIFVQMAVALFPGDCLCDQPYYGCCPNNLGKFGPP